MRILAWWTAADPSPDNSPGPELPIDAGGPLEAEQWMVDTAEWVRAVLNGPNGALALVATLSVVVGYLTYRHTVKSKYDELRLKRDELKLRREEFEAHQSASQHGSLIGSRRPNMIGHYLGFDEENRVDKFMVEVGNCSENPIAIRSVLEKSSRRFVDELSVEGGKTMRPFQVHLEPCQLCELTFQFRRKGESIRNITDALRRESEIKDFGFVLSLTTGEEYEVPVPLSYKRALSEGSQSRWVRFSGAMRYS